LLDLLYAHTARARRRWYERHPQARRRLSRPVLSIGNLSVGGTGKTPLVARIAEWLSARGERPAILSRGYGRAVRADGAVVVSDGTRVLANLDQAGDEPLMLARRVPGAAVVVAEDRHLAGVLAERRLGATVHVLDDGFQHVQLARDLDILLTSVGEIPNGRVLPFGRLREGADAAARAHLVVVVDADRAAAQAEAWTLGISQSVAARRVLGEPIRNGEARAPAEAARLAVAGLANPEQFFAMLRGAGHPIAKTIGFADHHRYDARDVARIAAELVAAGAAAVMTTAKDAVRFERLGVLPFALEVVPMQLEIDGWDLVTETIDAALLRAREAA
jgi:tetraacyldisaccharide 4'-kinase